MGFSEALKSDLRRRADMRCCVCHSIGVELHHIVPVSEGGTDEEDNAAPLCPSCHETYGANPVKRKFIRESKVNWLMSCSLRQHGTPDLGALIEFARNGVTRNDLADLRRELVLELKGNLQPSAVAPKPQTLGDIFAFVYNLDVDSEKVRDRDTDLAYLAMFGPTWNDEEMEDIRKEFLGKFGSETARRFCRYALQDHPVVRFADGFTDEDMDALLNRLMVCAIMLLHHSELAPKDFSLDLSVTEKGDLLGRLRKGELGSKSVEALPIKALQPTAEARLPFDSESGRG